MGRAPSAIRNSQMTLHSDDVSWIEFCIEFTEYRVHWPLSGSSLLGSLGSRCRTCSLEASRYWSLLVAFNPTTHIYQVPTKDVTEMTEWDWKMFLTDIVSGKAEVIPPGVLCSLDRLIKLCHRSCSPTIFCRIEPFNFQVSIQLERTKCWSRT